MNEATFRSKCDEVRWRKYKKDLCHASFSFLFWETWKMRGKAGVAVGEPVSYSQTCGKSIWQFCSGISFRLKWNSHSAYTQILNSLSSLSGIDRDKMHNPPHQHCTHLTLMKQVKKGIISGKLHVNLVCWWKSQELQEVAEMPTNKGGHV